MGTEGFELISDVKGIAFVVVLNQFGAGVCTVEVFHGPCEKTPGAAGRVTDTLVGFDVDQFDHHVYDVPWRAELAVDASCG
ncbi:hypothetical protein D3C75_1180660 [compost metagenome]